MSQNNLEQLSHRSILRLLWEYSAPAVTGMMVTSLYNIIDRIYIGQGVGPEAIAGLGVTFPIANLSTAMGVLIGGGASARTSIMLGAKDQSSAEQVLGNSLILTLVIGTLYTSLFWIFLDDILYTFGASDVTLPYARDFMVWFMPCMLLTNLCFNLNNIMRASGYPMKAMITMIIGAVCNIILAPIFIFGLDLGIKGAAIASDISMAISTVFVVMHFFNPKVNVHFRRGTYKLRWRIVYDIMSIGAAPALVNAINCLITITVNNSLKDYGTDIYVGAASIYLTYTQFIAMFILGLGIGMQPIIGYNYGAGHLHRLKKTYILAASIATGVATAGCLFGTMCPRWIAMVFTSDTELLDVTAHGIKLGIMAFWVVGFQIISTNFFQSIGKAGKSIFMSLLRQAICLYPLLVTLPPIMGIDGVWLSFPISDGVATVVTIALVIWQFYQIRSARIEPKLASTAISMTK